MKVKNTAPGLRGLHTVSGFLEIEPGATVDVEMTDGEYASALATGHFEFDGEPPAAEPVVEDPNAALDKLSVGELETTATAEGVDVAAIAGTGANGRVLKADIVAAIIAKRAAPTTAAVDELDAMDDATLRTTVQAITGTEPAADLDRAALLALARGTGSGQ